ncbi:hypothetical protein HMPREF0454_04726 [Hafnia alvei ATCC 51873]|uniref:Uncharacterized protein n=1 Tax=Hafnia alvei ATCC 51873 TaxID=1002364 RepID=G9YDM8_HAFAL|nr:hypothetical protein HMPREF0454_04726 [Hafnia alvei ATCC 51873]
MHGKKTDSINIFKHRLLLIKKKNERDEHEEWFRCQTEIQQRNW